MRAPGWHRASGPSGPSTRRSGRTGLPSKATSSHTTPSAVGVRRSSRPLSGRHRPLTHSTPRLGETGRERSVGAPVEYVGRPGGIDDAVLQIARPRRPELRFLLGACNLGAEPVHLADVHGNAGSEVVDATPG